MANNIKGITIEIGGETTKLDQALKNVNSTTKSLKSELKEIDKALKLDPKNTELLSQKQKVLAESIQATKEKLTTLKEAQEQAQKAFEAGDLPEEKYRALQREIVNTEAELKRLQDEAEKTKTTFESVGTALQEAGDKIHAAGEKVQKVGEGFTNAGEKLLPVTAAIAGVGTASVAAAVDFEDAMAKLNTIADTSEKTGVPLEELEKQIKELSDQTGISAAEIADNVYNAISAGQDTGDAVNFVANSTKLATAGFADSGQALDLLTTILNAYGMEADKVTRVSDVLINTQNLGKTTVGELASAMGKVIPTANASNVSLENLAAGYSIMTARGIATAESTTYMNSMLNELSKSGTTASDTIKNKTGKSFQDLMKEGASLADVLTILQEEADANGLAMNDMFGSAEAGKAALTLLSGGAEEFNQTLDSMNNATGTTDEAFAKLDTTSRKAKIALNEIKNSAIELGGTILDMVMPYFQQLTQKIKDVTTWFNNLDDSQKKMIVKIGAVVAAVGPALIIVGKIITTVGKVISIGGTLIKGVGTVIKTIGVLKNGIMAINAVMAANPIMLIVMAIAALVAAFVTLYNKCEWFRDGVNKIWEAIKNAFLKAFEGIKKFFTETLPNAFNKVKEGLSNLKSKITDAFKGAHDKITATWKNVGTWFSDRWQNIKDGAATAGNWIKDKFTEAHKNTTEAWKNVGSWFGDKFSAIKDRMSGVKDFLSNNWQGCATALVNPFAGGFKLLYDNCDGFRDFIDGWVAKIKEFFGNLWSGIQDIFGNVGSWFTEKFQAAHDGIASVFGKIGEWFGQRWEDIKNALSTVATWYLNTWKAAWDNVVSIWKAVGEWFAARWTDIKNALSTVATWFLTMFQNAYNNVVNVWKAIGQWFSARWTDIKNALSTVATWFQTMFQNAYNNVVNIWKAIGQWFAARWTDIKNALSTVATWFQTMFQNAYNNVVNVWKAIGSWFAARYEDIKSAISGIPEMFRSTFQSAYDKVTGIFKGIGDWFKTNVIDKIKSLFDGFSLADAGTRIMNSFVNAIKSVHLPKLSVSWGELEKTIGDVTIKIPVPRISWNALGGIFTNPTLFGMAGGRLQGIGEAGPEAVLPLDTFYQNIESYINNAVERTAAAVAGQQAKGRGDFIQNNNYYSPKALSPAEAARQTRNATRNMVLALQGGTV